METDPSPSMKKASAKPSEIMLLNEVSDIRKIWPKEARDFTPWLSSQALAALGEILGIEIESDTAKTEVKTAQSDRRCDIVASVKENGEVSKIIIENQIDKADIGHLGRLVLYAATNSAKYAVWVVSDVEPDYETTIRWLNDNTTASLYFYLVKVVAYQLENGKVGARFHLVEGPDNVAKVNTSGTPKQKENVRFWSGFLTYLKNIDPEKMRFRATQQPSVASDYYIHIGTSLCNIRLEHPGQDAQITILTHGKQNSAIKILHTYIRQMASDIGIAEDKIEVSGDIVHPFIRFKRPAGSLKAKDAETYLWLYESLNKIVPFVQKILGAK